MLLYHGSLFRKALPSLRRPISSLVERSLEKELTARRLPLAYDYLTPQASHLLQLSLLEHLPREVNNKGTVESEDPRKLPSVQEQRHLPPGHHLVYFPPQVTLSELLRDGTDVLHTPGEPFHRRLWAGGNVVFPRSGSLILNGQRAVCVENISNVNVKGREGEEKIFVTIERRFSTVAEDEDEAQLRSRVVNSPGVLTETRDLVFLREPDLEARGASNGKASRLVKCMHMYRAILTSLANINLPKSPNRARHQSQINAQQGFTIPIFGAHIQRPPDSSRPVLHKGY